MGNAVQHLAIWKVEVSRDLDSFEVFRRDDRVLNETGTALKGMSPVAASAISYKRGVEAFLCDASIKLDAAVTK